MTRDRTQNLDKRQDRSTMSDFAGFCRRLSAALALAVLAATGTAAVAQADNYGEIGHPFGSAGKGKGQFETTGSGSAGFGVEQTTDDVYVANLAHSETNENEFQIQRFDPNPTTGEYEVVATETFIPADTELKEEELDEISNIAVDPRNHRIYVLASEERPESSEFDPGEYAASQLWAFSTAGGKLAKVETGVLANTGVFKPQGKKEGEALLDPNGIAFDPATEGVIVLGSQEKINATTKGSEPVIALDQISKEGKLIGKRWVDTTDVLEDGVSSPVVTKSGKVLVGNYDEIDEIPESFETGKPPTSVFQLDPPIFVINEEGELEEEEPAPELLTFFPGSPEPVTGGGLSLGEEGTLYYKASITQQHPKEDTGPTAPGVQLISSAAGAEEKWAEDGWTGGQSVATVGAGGPCKISPSVPVQVAAGEKEQVFVFDMNPKDPRVIEFGPGGSGCAHGSVTETTTSVNHVLVPETESIPIKDTVELSSVLIDATALSVEWEFGDGTHETVSTNEHQTTEVEHKFLEPGELTVTETIDTDNLAEPVIVVHRKIDIQGPKPVVVAGAASGVTQTAATLNATVNPEGSAVKTCTFEYGTTLPSGKTEPCNPLPGSGKTAEAVSASIGGLSAGTTYDVKIVATSASGTGEATTTFKTTVAVNPKPVVLAGAASGVTQTSATLNATVNPEGSAVTACTFDYGTTTAYGLSAPCASLPGSGSAAVAVSAAIGSLSAGTTYDVKIVATNANGTEDATTTFKTEAAPTKKEETPPPPKEETTITTTPIKQVLPFTAVSPTVTVIGGSASVSSTGAFTLKLQCATGASSCAGTITLKTPKAVVASVGHEAKAKKPKAAIITLATGSFTLAGGQVKTLTLHLTSTARTLLGRSHDLSALTTILAHDSSGDTHTTTVTVSLRAAKTAKKH
jgi:PKD domain